MPLAYDRNFSLGKQSLPLKSRDFIYRAGKQQINGPEALKLHRGWALPWQNIDPNTGSVEVHTLDQRGHNEVGDVVLHHNRKTSRTSLGLKRIGNKDSLNSL